MQTRNLRYGWTALPCVIALALVAQGEAGSIDASLEAEPSVEAAAPSEAPIETAGGGVLIPQRVKSLVAFRQAVTV